MEKNTLSQAQIEQIVKLSNEVRRRAGAANMYEVKWDPALADIAEGEN